MRELIRPADICREEEEEEEGQTKANGGGLSDYCGCQLYDRLTVTVITIPDRAR